jgi:hypothetical protein
VGDDPTAHNRPYLRLIRGDASPEEVAAVVAVLTARGARFAGATAGGATSPAPPVSAWADPSLAMRRGTHPAPGAWRLSGHAPGVRTRADW